MRIPEKFNPTQCHYVVAIRLEPIDPVNRLLTILSGLCALGGMGGSIALVEMGHPYWSRLLLLGALASIAVFWLAAFQKPVQRDASIKGAGTILSDTVGLSQHDDRRFKDVLKRTPESLRAEVAAHLHEGAEINQALHEAMVLGLDLPEARHSELSAVIRRLESTRDRWISRDKQLAREVGALRSHQALARKLQAAQQHEPQALDRLDRLTGLTQRLEDGSGS